MYTYTHTQKHMCVQNTVQTPKVYTPKYKQQAYTQKYTYTHTAQCVYQEAVASLIHHDSRQPFILKSGSVSGMPEPDAVTNLPSDSGIPDFGMPDSGMPEPDAVVTNLPWGRNYRAGVCMYVCVYVCMYICVCVCVCV